MIENRTKAIAPKAEREGRPAVGVLAGVRSVAGASFTIGQGLQQQTEGTGPGWARAVDCIRPMTRRSVADGDQGVEARRKRNSSSAFAGDGQSGGVHGPGGRVVGPGYDQRRGIRG